MSKILPLVALFFSFTLFADANADLEAALWAKDLTALNAALAAGADVRHTDPSGQNWLHLAVVAEFDDAIAVLAAAGVPVDGLDRSGSTPLHIAASNGRARASSALSAAGANPRIQNNAGLLPIDLARFQRYPAMVARLERRLQALEPIVPPPAPRRSVFQRLFSCFAPSSHAKS